MIQKKITQQEAIAIRSMYQKSPDDFVLHEGEVIYGWTLFDENNGLINADKINDFDLVVMFYEHLGAVDE